MTQHAYVYPGASDITNANLKLSFVLSAIPAAINDGYQKNLSNIYDSSIMNNLNESFQQLDNLEKLSDNWDGYGSACPDILAINQAKILLKKFFSFFSQFLPEKALSNPNITADSEGNVLYEWWVSDKKLSVYISSDKITYIKVAGERIEDMEDGNFSLQEFNLKLFYHLFGWLVR